MEANAPKKIYISPLPNHSDGYVGVAWDEPYKTMVEYIRTDAFIEKAFEFFGEHLLEYTDAKYANCVIHIRIDGDKLKEDFEKYMKGE